MVFRGADLKKVSPLECGARAGAFSALGQQELAGREEINNRLKAPQRCGAFLLRWQVAHGRKGARVRTRGAQKTTNRSALSHGSGSRHSPDLDLDLFFALVRGAFTQAPS